MSPLNSVQPTPSDTRHSISVAMTWHTLKQHLKMLARYYTQAKGMVNSDTGAARTCRLLAVSLMCGSAPSPEKVVRL